MFRFGIATRGVSAIALASLMAVPALAESKGDRAQKAIAEAGGKVDAANKATGGWTPDIQAQAEAALRASKEDVAAGHKERAIADANHASELADVAIGHANERRAAAVGVQQADAHAATVAAQQQADAAQQQVAAVQQDAAVANARADVAEQTAATATAQADALRNAPPATTTVTTVQKDQTQVVPAAHPAPRKIVRRSGTAAHTVNEKSTTTTVSTTPSTND